MTGHLAVHVAVTGVASTYITIIGAILAIVGINWSSTTRKHSWLVTIVCVLATAAAISTPKFGPWLQAYLHNLTNGILGR